MTAPSTLPQLSTVRLANRSILVIVLLAGAIFSTFSVDLGTSPAVAFCLDALVVLLALQYLLRGTLHSPLGVLKRCRGVSLLTAIGVVGLLVVFDVGFLNFASAFMPRLYGAIVEPQAASNSVWELPLYLLGFAVLAPFYEELVFRGLALSAYQSARSTPFAVLFTSVLFGLIHGSVVGFLTIFPAGIVLALVRLKTGQLRTSILVHGLYNLAGTLLFALAAGTPDTRATPLVGILGIVVAAAALLGAVVWLRLPKILAEENGSIEKKKIWTVSLIVVVTLASFSVVATTYEALGPGIRLGL